MNKNIEKGEISMRYNLGRDKLFWRIGNEKSDELIEDIKKLDSVDFSDDIGRTYLHIACSAHNFEVAKLLLKKGANPNCRDKQGRLPIMSSIGRVNEKNPDFLRVFLEYGLDMNEKVHDMTLKEVIESFEDEELNAVIKSFEKK